MEPDFIATIKLITGEEIISRVSYMPDDDSLVLEYPMEVTRVDNIKKNIRVAGFALTEWIRSTFDHMFVLPKKHIITMTEIEDSNIKNFYTISVQQQQIQLSQFKEATNPQNFTRDMGHLGSVNKTKQNLEDLYKRS
tara:strand:- start:8463 stop:8873 length:411 start_codon:yes stop_codon:yes gene_type:complete